MVSEAIQISPRDVAGTRESKRESGRITALDFTKGALVLIMVLYHWLNYFYGPHDSRYLRFLTPSFIFITGFLVSNVYISRYGVRDPKVPKRLLQRGLKILAVFAVLNVTRDLLAPSGLQDRLLSANWSLRSFIDVYVTGSGVGVGQSKAVAFFVLVPIGYLLIIAAPLLVLSRSFRYVFHLSCLAFFAGIGALYYFGLESPNLELLAIGLLGVLAGYLPIARVDELVRHPITLIAGYLLYLGAIYEWNVAYPLQIIGVYLSLMIIYVVGLHEGEPGRIRACVVLLGKYSLLGYIAQIAILQILHVVLRRINSEAAMMGLSFVLAFGLTIVSVELVDRARSASKVVDRVYRAIFA